MITTAPADKLYVILHPARIAKLAALAANGGTSITALASRMLSDATEAASEQTAGQAHEMKEEEALA